MTPCTEWHKARSSAGYGQKSVDGKVLYVHRLEYEKHHGPIPKGMVVRHRCDNPACYNIEHLEIGTQKENMRDMWERGRAVNNAPKGERQHKAVLTEELVHYIRASPLSGDKLALELNINKSTVNRVRSRKTWRHV